MTIGQPTTHDASFDEFARAHTPTLFRVAMSLTGGDSNGAWDLTQDTFERLHRAWPGVVLDQNSLAYAKKTMTRLNLNRIRQRKRELAALARHAMRRPLAHGDSDESSTQAIHALSALSPQQRTAISLVHIWGHSIPETAELIGCAPNTVKTHLSRGLTHLREITEALGDSNDHPDTRAADSSSHA